MLKKILFIVLLACLVGCASKDKEDILTVPGYRNINDLREKRICVLLGSTNDDYVTKTFPEATILRASEISDLIIMLKNDKCDVIVMDDLIYYFSANGDPEISIIEKNLYEGHTGIGFGLKNTELRDEFNIMLEEFRNDGTYDQIYERWLSNTTTVNVKMPILDLPQTGTPLRVGVTGSEIPFSYYHEGKIV
ncbi:MAG: transporter substrate-binding domain-containing protein, partial [Rikenellaceae bacterium]